LGSLSSNTLYPFPPAFFFFYYRGGVGGLACFPPNPGGPAGAAPHVHSPIDIIGGIIMAIIAASAGYFVTEKWLGAKRHAVRPQDSR
jgi:H+/gluconate symporter-like permease